jgi:thiamine biosynthesis lipoprotein
VSSPTYSIPVRVGSRSYSIPARTAPVEHRHTFECFGGTCTVIVADARRPANAAEAAATAKRSLLRWHDRFSRFEPDSELVRFNRDPRTEVPVSPMLRRLLEVAVAAAKETGGLVDATLGGEIEHVGYDAHFEGQGVGIERALSLAPSRAPAGANPAMSTSAIAIDPTASTVRRPPGTALDPGGIAKGVFADQLAGTLTEFDAFALDCAGDIRLGGRAGLVRRVHITSPFDDRRLHTFALRTGGIATSGISKRSWIDDNGAVAHHLLDPRTGRPAFTGLVQATALATTAARAEVLAKAALLSGPERASKWLSHGGLLVRDDGGCELLEAAGD